MWVTTSKEPRKKKKFNETKDKEPKKRLKKGKRKKKRGSTLDKEPIKGKKNNNNISKKRKRKNEVLTLNLHWESTRGRNDIFIKPLPLPIFYLI